MNESIPLAPLQEKFMLWQSDPDVVRWLQRVNAKIRNNQG